MFPFISFEDFEKHALLKLLFCFFFQIAIIIEQLSLQVNNLEGSLPDELPGMESLEQLKVGRNKFGGDIPDSLSKLEKLRKYLQGHMQKDYYSRILQSNGINFLLQVSLIYPIMILKERFLLA